jgi:hypothetical protein
MSDRDRQRTKPDRLARLGRSGKPALDGRPWSVPIQLAEIPAGGRHIKLVPDAETRASIASALGLASLPSVDAEFDLMPLAADGVKVSGMVSATVEQTCVVTLEPLVNEVNERIDLVLVQPGAMPPPRATLDIDVTAEADLPDVLHDGAVDLGEVAVEFLSLGIDPYPRKHGVTFEPPPSLEDPASHPFAALKAWRKKSE